MYLKEATSSLKMPRNAMHQRLTVASAMGKGYVVSPASV